VFNFDDNHQQDQMDGETPGGELDNLPMPLPAPMSHRYGGRNTVADFMFRNQDPFGASGLMRDVSQSSFNNDDNM
jgi:hypothetical protein